MNPVDALPPGMPLALQETPVLVEPAMVAFRVCDAPKRTDAEAGVTVTLTEEGVGGRGVGVIEPVSPPAQPATLAAKARKAKTKGAEESSWAAALEWVTVMCERGRMLWRNAGEGPAGRRESLHTTSLQRAGQNDGKLLESWVLLD